MRSSRPSDLDTQRQSISTRLTPTEVAAVAIAAQRLDITRADWLRQAVQLSLANPSSSALPEMSILLAEVLALRSLIVNLFPTAIAGLPISSVLQIMHNADATKGSQAAAMLRKTYAQVPSHET